MFAKQKNLPSRDSPPGSRYYFANKSRRD
jgi:hypothetical protein